MWKTRSNRQQSATKGAPHRFRPVRHAELSTDRRHVKLYGLVADPKADGNLLVRETLREELQDLAFA